MPSERTMVTELGTGLGMLGPGDLDDGGALAHGGHAQPVPGDLGTPGRAARRGRLRRRVPCRLGQRAGLLGRERRAARPHCRTSSNGRAPDARRVTRWRPSTCGWTTSTWSAASTSRTSSSTCHRPTSSTRCWPGGRRGPARPSRRGRCRGRSRLVRRGGAGRLPGALRGRARRRDRMGEQGTRTPWRPAPGSRWSGGPGHLDPPAGGRWGRRAAGLRDR